MFYPSESDEEGHRGRLVRVLDLVRTRNPQVYIPQLPLSHFETETCCCCCFLLLFSVQVSFCTTQLSYSSIPLSQLPYSKTYHENSTIHLSTSHGFFFFLVPIKTCERSFTLKNIYFPETFLRLIYPTTF